MDRVFDRVVRVALHRGAHRGLDAFPDHAEWCRLDRELGDRAGVIKKARELVGVGQPDEDGLVPRERAFELCQSPTP
jgi:hypothetical protein